MLTEFGKIFVFIILAGAFVGIVINWIQSENPDSPERMGKFYREITKPILRTVVCNGELDYIFR